MRYTWWLSRPKRSLVTAPRCLIGVANVAEGRVWETSSKEVALAVEKQLEDSGVKRVGTRRDQGGGGARTYRAWLKSLGLIFMGPDKIIRLTSAGEAIVKGEDPLPILKKLVLTHQFPSAFSSSGASAVSPEFRVRPFIFLLQLLRHPLLNGELSETDEVAKLAVTYGVNNNTETVDAVAERILLHRRAGDASLDTDFLEKFRSTRGKEETLESLFGNLKDIANTAANWLGYTQLIMRDDGIWKVTPGAEDEVDKAIAAALRTPLIPEPESEEKFQRKYGLLPGQKKDTRNLDGTRNVTSKVVEESSIEMSFLRICSTEIVTELTPELKKRVAAATGSPIGTVDFVLAKKYPTGSLSTFMGEYAQMAFESRNRATEFEKATASIFSDVFGFNVTHVGQQGRRPDVIIRSVESDFSAIIDTKAYASGYSLGISQQNRMRDYVEQFHDYSPDSPDLNFFLYVVAEGKSRLDYQLSELIDTVGIAGSAITARDMIALVKRYQSAPISHEELSKIFSQGKLVKIA